MSEAIDSLVSSNPICFLASEHAADLRGAAIPIFGND